MPDNSKLSLREINQITKQYGLSNCESFNLLHGGSENTNFLIVENDSKYVLTICEQKTEQEAKNLASLLAHLEKYEFTSSKVLLTTGGILLVLGTENQLCLKII